MSKNASAADVIASLKTAGLPIGFVESYTAENDGNKLLGRPNQYISKSNFRDTRISTSTEADVDTSDGGSVEIFSNTDDAKSRAAYIASIGKAVSAATEYDFQNGKVLLRVSSTVTPTQADEYKTKLATVLSSK